LVEGASYGDRRCYPEGLYLGTETPEEWIFKAFPIGLAILSRAKNLTAEQIHSYRAMAVLFAYRSVFQEHKNRRFARSSDLYITPSGREDRRDPRERTVLSALGAQMSVSEFMKMGTTAAQSRGIAKPTEEQQIQYGLLAWAEKQGAATQTPTPDALAAAMRHALFGTPLTSEFLDQVLDHPIVPRLMKNIEKHLGDPPDKFRRWFQNSVSRGFVHLARQTKSAGGVLPDEIAKHVVVALVWRSYQYVGDCLHAFMHTVRRSFDPPFGGDEAELFDRQWLCQDVFGGLPLILVRERLQVLWPAIARGLESPKEQLPIGVVHRMLSAYAIISDKRREADNRIKHARDKTRNPPKRDPESVGTRISAERQRAKDRIEKFLEEQGLRCNKCPSTALRLADSELPRDGVAQLWLECCACRSTMRHDYSEVLLKTALADPETSHG